MSTQHRLFFLCLFALLPACADESNASRESPGASHYFTIGIGDKELHLQLALTRTERARGLMHRENLEENHGMLFLASRPHRQSFWMRNTGIPLDLAFFDARGQLLDVHALYPYNEDAVESRSDTALIAVETPRGWFDRNNIEPGAKLDLEALIKAIEARGHSAEHYPLKP